MGTSYQNLVIEKIHKLLPSASDAEVRQYIAGTSSSLSDSLTSSQSIAIIDAIIVAMRSVWILLAVAGGICVVLSLFLGVCSESPGLKFGNHTLTFSPQIERQVIQGHQRNSNRSINVAHGLTTYELHQVVLSAQNGIVDIP